MSLEQGGWEGKLNFRLEANLLQLSNDIKDQCISHIWSNKLWKWNGSIILNVFHNL